MFGKQSNIRKKAMDSMMKEGPSIEFKKKPAPEMEMADQEQSPEQEGFESFMVSPEEKQMILQMRQKAQGQAEAEVSEEEMG